MGDLEKTQGDDSGITWESISYFIDSWIMELNKPVNTKNKEKRKEKSSFSWFDRENMYEFQYKIASVSGKV